MPSTSADADRAIIASANDWLAQDPDPETRAELTALLTAAAAQDAGAAAARAELLDRFGSRLAFGTAGLRGELGAGSARMNRVLVAQAAAGFAAYLNEQAGEGAQPSVVIGYDGRKNSDVFARDSAELMAAAGVLVHLFPHPVPTPVLAFAVRHLGVSAGVMVTASHNPPRDNGYKVYLGGANAGAQISAPADRDIAAHIERVAAGSISTLARSDEYHLVDAAVLEAYIAATSALATRDRGADNPERAPLRVVYTAMHGVGWATASRVFAAAGLPAPMSVPSQQEPDSAFPTVDFPNPEEPGAMDASFALAREHGADLIVANDPDADRLAIALPDPERAEGFRRLTGNEVGLLLGWRVASLRARAGLSGGTFACTIVSSPGLGVIAAAFGCEFVETLTGFKWLARTPNLVFAFEEALGYLVNPQTVRDKDGISAAVVLLDLAEELHAAGSSLAAQLADLTATFGAFASAQVSIRVTDLSFIAMVMERLRQRPPAEIGGVPVVAVADFAAGIAGFAPSNVLRFTLADGSRVIARPSGTEPKLKVYLDTQCTVGTVSERRETCAATLAAIEAGVRELIAG